MTAIPPGFHGAARRLTVADVDRVAGELGVEARVLWAVGMIEAADHGFIADGRPEILYESHQFSQRTNGKWDDSHPGISQPTWVRDYGAAGGHQYDRLAEAMALDRLAALKATSWGLFQITGDNGLTAGFASVDDFVAAMCESEGRQLEAFADYCRAETPLVQYLHDHDWLNFALRYNGPRQAENNYAGKLEDAYKYGVFPPAGIPQGPAEPPPAPNVVRLPLGEQCSFPVSGENEHGEPTLVPPDALTSDDTGICKVSVADDIATVVSVALGQTKVRGPELEISVTIIPMLVRVKADLSKIVYSRIGAMLARVPLAAGAAALALTLTMPPAETPFLDPAAIVVAVPADVPKPESFDLGTSPIIASVSRTPSVFDGSTFCFGPGLRVVPIEECGK